MKFKGTGLLLFFAIIFMSALVLAEPFGGNLTEINSTRVGAYAADDDEAFAGNVTEINVYGISTTQSWQGYFGNVTGTIQLADPSSNVMYNWSVASPRGQIYSSTNGTGILWQYIQCFNFTAKGDFASDKTNAGSTSLNGRNLTQLQEEFGVQERDDDSVNRTFHYRDATEGHRLFYTNSLEFEAGECQSARIYGDSASQTDGEFEEVLLYEPESRSVVYTSLLNEDMLGFDNKAHDFEMLVLEDGHGTDLDTTTYYFYLELY